MRGWEVVIDYRMSGIKIYPFYYFDNAVSCYEYNADPDQKDRVLSVALFDTSDNINIPEKIKEKIWRD